MSPQGQKYDHPKKLKPGRLRRTAVTVTIAGAMAPLGLIAPSPAGAAVRAWECSTGNVCVWNGVNGTGGRCIWSDADPDWWSGSIACSWADTQNARSAYNLGTSSSFGGVAFYSGANYTGYLGCITQNGGWDSDFNVRIRSHRWVSSC